MMNWKNLFSETAAIESKVDLETRRSEMLDKLLSANKGMSKLSGNTAESMQEMMQNEELMRMLGEEINTTPQIMSVIDEQGQEVTDYSQDEDIRALQEEIARGEFEGVENLTPKSSEASNSNTFIDAEFTESTTESRTESRGNSSSSTNDYSDSSSSSTNDYSDSSGNTSDYSGSSSSSDNNSSSSSDYSGSSSAQSD